MHYCIVIEKMDKCKSAAEKNCENEIGRIGHQNIPHQSGLNASTKAIPVDKLRLDELALAPH